MIETEYYSVAFFPLKRTLHCNVYFSMHEWCILSECGICSRRWMCNYFKLETWDYII